MKTGLLTLAALTWAASAMAGDWEEPVFEFTVEDSYKVDPVDGGVYLIYNEAAGQFLCGSNDWGTQASVKPLSEANVTFKLVYEPLEQDKDVMAWGMLNQRSDKFNKYVFFDGGDGTGGSFIDMGTQNNTNKDCHHWNFEKQEDGTYTIQIVKQSNNYREGCYFAWNGSEEGIVVPGFNIAAADQANAEALENGEEVYEYGMYWSFISTDAYNELYALYQTRLNLYNMLVESEEVYDDDENLIEVDITRAEEVYNNPDATKEELEAAIKDLGLQITQGKLGNKFEGASPENPVDATFLIKNPSFDQSTGANASPGWDTNFGFMAPDGVNPHPMGANGVEMDAPYHESWTAGGNKLGDFHCIQTLAGLPAGAYVLGITAVATQQGDSDADIEGVSLYAEYNGKRVSVACSSEPGQDPIIYGLPFIVEEDGTNVTIGFEVKSTNANWVAFDNWTLEYQGNEASPELLVLKQEITKCEGLANKYQDDNTGRYYYSSATWEALTAIIEEALEMNIATSAEELVAITEKMQALYAQAMAEKEAYNKLNTLYDRAQAGVEFDISEVAEAFVAVVGQIEEGWFEGTLTIEEIEAIEAECDRIINEVLPAHIVPDTDLTVMLKNPDFSSGNANGWEGTKATVQNGCAEFYEKEFDMYQDLHNLPEGLYEVSLSGFVRQGFIAEAGANYLNGTEDIRASIYGQTGLASENIKEKATLFPSLAGSADTEGTHYSSREDAEALGINPGDSNFDNYYTDAEGNECYCANGMTGFTVWKTIFPERFKTSATVFVTDGTLRIGIRCTEHKDNGFWCIFDDFKIRYVSADMISSLIEELDKKIDRLIEKRDDLIEKQPLPKDIYEKIGALKAELAAIERTEDAVDAMSAKIAALDKEMVATANEYKVQLERFNFYAGKMEEITDSEDNTFSVWVDDVITKGTYNLDEYAFDGGFLWDTTEEMQAQDKDMRARWTHFVTAVPDFAAATADKPVEVSEVILNHDFPVDYDFVENAEFTRTYGWEGTKGGTMQGTTAVSEYEFYNTAFDTYQTIYGLPKGWYYVQAQGFYRQGGIDEAADSLAAGTYNYYAVLYASVNGNESAKPFMGIYDDAAEESLTDEYEVNKAIKIGEEEKTYYFPNMMLSAQAYFQQDKYAGNNVGFEVTEDDAVVKLGIKKDSLVKNDWTIFDNVQLFYTGSQRPNSVNTIVAGGAVKQAYYTIGGLQVARPQRGVNIVVTTLSDGTKVTSKVLVK